MHGTREPARSRRGRWALRAGCLYAALIPFQPVMALGDGSPLRIAAADLVAPVLVLAALVRPQRRLAPALALPLLALAIVASFSTLLAASARPMTGYAVGKTAGLLYVIAIGAALARALPPDSEARLLRALAAGGRASAVIGLVGFALWMSGRPTSLVEWERLCSTMSGDPNIYGSLLAITILITAADARRSAAWRGVRLAMLVTALALTASRSAFMALFAGAAVYAFVRTRARWITAARAVYGVTGVAVVSTLLLLTDPGQRAAQVAWDRTSRTFTVESRFDLYARAFEQWSEHPIVGLGIGGFYELNDWGAARDEHYAVHNTYLWALVDMGVVGGLLLATTLVGAIARCVRAAPHRGADAALVAAGLAAMAVFDLFVDGYYQRHLWVLMACALGMPALRARRAARASRRPVDAAPSWAWAQAR
jgi:O-antigen ligase